MPARSGIWFWALEMDASSMREAISSTQRRFPTVRNRDSTKYSAEPLLSSLLVQL